MAAYEEKKPVFGEIGMRSFDVQRAPCEKRRSAAEEVIQMAESICARAVSIADEAERKLSPLILRRDGNQCTSPPVPEMPEFFDALRDKLSGIDSALDRISSTVSGVDL